LAPVTVVGNGGPHVLPDDFEVKEHCLAMPFPLAVASGETQEEKFFLYQPAHSQRKSAKVNVMYWAEATMANFACRGKDWKRSLSTKWAMLA